MKIRAFLLFVACFRAAAAKTTHTGYLTDIYCWERPNRIALDGAKMDTEPQKHTVHCLRDIQVCIDSGYGVLEKASGSDTYTLKYTFDAEGNKNVLALVQKTRATSNFLVTVTGEADGSVLKAATIVEGTGESAAEDEGDGDAGTPMSATIKPARTTEPLIFVHIVCMALGWGCCIPWAIALARTRVLKIGGVLSDAWLRTHRRLNIAGWVLQLVGFAAIVAHVQGLGKPHFSSGLHTTIGIVVVALGTLQPLNGLLRPHKAADGEEQSGARLWWERLHKSIGYVAVLLAIIVLCTGIGHASLLSYSQATIGTAAALVVLGLAPALVFYALASCSPTGAQPFARFLFGLGGLRDEGDSGMEGEKVRAA